MGRGPTSCPEKLGQRIRLLGSDREGEAVAALHAVRKLLAANNETFNDLADRIEKANGIDEAEVRRIYDAGVVDGLSKAQAAQYGRATFRSINEARDRWGQVCDYVERNINRLAAKDVGPITGIIASIRNGVAPSPRQSSWLIEIMRRMGGTLP